MDNISSITELRQCVRRWKDNQESIAFIPTMGNLHKGHLSLIEKGQSHCDRTICSIFVNPMQFGPNEDFNHYPRTLEQDLTQLRNIGCDLVYLPTASELYPDGLEYITQIKVTNLTNRWEGSHRSGHFAGVATIVLKLFNVVKPNVSIFGKKDFQQYRVISKMVDDLNLDVDIIGAETTREDTGLATSSRNQYLNETQLQQAGMIYRVLQKTAEKIQSGERDYLALEAKANEYLMRNGFDPDYLAVCQADTLEPANRNDLKLVLLIAAHLGQTRLIDNVEIDLLQI